MVIGREMFSDAKTGAITLAQQVNARELPLLAEAIKAPDEIWARLEWQQDQGKAVLRRRYLAHVQVKGQSEPAVAVFDQGADGWTGVTGFVDDRHAGPFRRTGGWRRTRGLYRTTVHCC